MANVNSTQDTGKNTRRILRQGADPTVTKVVDGQVFRPMVTNMTQLRRYGGIGVMADPIAKE